MGGFTVFTPTNVSQCKYKHHHQFVKHNKKQHQTIAKHSQTFYYEISENVWFIQFNLFDLIGNSLFSHWKMYFLCFVVFLVLSEFTLAPAFHLASPTGQTAPRSGSPAPRPRPSAWSPSCEPSWRWWLLCRNRCVG
ncbi:hypothetical protein PFLUV_G00110980 [Perca fluviatilis]|uniref:Uncharacterized protein n=1 Tax=Perca fluviatilis TaxID=8168 RepID=A0A6A5F5X6_PERFL|nr:hypothetical protein PFLUV_G00110980 [Perca fluviatilis]